MIHPVALRFFSGGVGAGGGTGAAGTTGIATVGAASCTCAVSPSRMRLVAASPPVA